MSQGTSSLIILENSSKSSHKIEALLCSANISMMLIPSSSNVYNVYCLFTVNVRLVGMSLVLQLQDLGTIHSHETALNWISTPDASFGINKHK